MVVGHQHARGDQRAGAVPHSLVSRPDANPRDRPGGDNGRFQEHHTHEIVLANDSLEGTHTNRCGDDGCCRADCWDRFVRDEARDPPLNTIRRVGGDGGTGTEFRLSLLPFAGARPEAGDRCVDVQPGYHGSFLR